jgi:hypothetical protein
VQQRLVVNVRPRGLRTRLLLRRADDELAARAPALHARNLPNQSPIPVQMWQR